MSKLRVGDTIMVRSGKYRTKTGTIEKIINQRMAIVGGINVVKVHQKKSAATPQGGIIDKVMPIQLSKLMLVDQVTKQPTRIRFEIKNKQKVRISVKGKTEIKQAKLPENKS